MNSKTITRGLTTASLAVFLTACANPMPRAELTTARASLEDAQRAGAEQHADQIYQTAAGRIGRAEELLANKRYKRARRLLELANAEAQLAEAVSDAASTDQAIAYLKEPNAKVSAPVLTSQIDE